ncbi:hypothetical protein GCM10010211_30750 [Streptomyces albospinus]|uniref:Uncharacterized protein n=1 Tax=Streptomyces albospinus TaxID=285515 RepID=A0ABQ2V0Q9_9ACTN|nr:hypothetical protein [Streptomyces albospinus]GGU63565.1 hypothetical protein GCM10010211_30750 [Streptomyces albospinus]
MKLPISGAALFRSVMTAAGWRCQCTGACGQPHAQSEGRCPREHDGYAGKHGGPVRLMAAPADPTITHFQAAALPAQELRAWCPGCLAVAQRLAKQQTPDTPTTDQSCLFDL